MWEGMVPLGFPILHTSKMDHNQNTKEQMLEDTPVHTHTHPCARMRKRVHAHVRMCTHTHMHMPLTLPKKLQTNRCQSQPSQARSPVTFYLSLIPRRPGLVTQPWRQQAAPGGPPLCAPVRTCVAARSPQASSHTPPAGSRSGQRYLWHTQESWH